MHQQNAQKLKLIKAVFWFGATLKSLFLKIHPKLFVMFQRNDSTFHGSFAGINITGNMWLNDIYLILTAEDFNYFGCKGSGSAHQASRSLTRRFPSVEGGHDSVHNVKSCIYVSRMAENLQTPPSPIPSPWCAIDSVDIS